MKSLRTVFVVLLALASFVTVAAAQSSAVKDPADIGKMQLGASYIWNNTAVQFRVYSAHATHIRVYLYTAGYGVQESASYDLGPSAIPDVWTVQIPVSQIQAAGITGTIYYGYRAWGPNWPYVAGWTKGSNIGFISDVDANGDRFDPNKLLLDPYAKEISQDPLNAMNQNPDIFASGPLYRDIDSGTYAPKGIVLPALAAMYGKPTFPESQDIIYEVNVRGLTEQDPNIPAQYRGTYYGAGLDAPYLEKLGVNTVEFLPMQETQNDENDVIPDSTADQNYWGYMTEDFFAPDRRYAYDKAPGGPTAEFREMVQMFHNAGIKVIMDVVYNHTAEGGDWSSTDPDTATVYSWRGLDNSTYYELTSNNEYNYDVTGTGNTLNTYNPVVQNMIVDSLAYWSNKMGVDGFRFDEAPVLGNDCINQSYEAAAPDCPNGGFNFNTADPNITLNRILRDFIVRPAAGGQGLDLFAEPWTASAGDYQGQFPKGWSEWNGVFQTTLREAQNKLGIIPVSIGTVADDFSGSSEIFESSGREPWNSVNYMDIHDGFTLNDLYSCDAPDNTQGWPYGPSTGGSTTNNSWDQGGNPADRRRAARTGFAFVMLSAGTPIFAGGDEYLRTLQCNNNPYNVDSPGNWLSYNWTTDQSNFYNFAQRAIAFRKAHPALRPTTWYTSSELEWWEPSGVQATTSYWDNPSNHAIAYTINGTDFKDPNSMYIAYNGWSGNVTFTLPPPPTGTNWYRVTDTCNWNDGPNTWVEPGDETEIGPAGTTYGLCGQSLLLLISK